MGKSNLIIISFLVLMASCSMAKLSKKSPPRAKNERFYDLAPYPGEVFHRKCKKKKGKNRKCTETFYDLNKEWSFFRDSNFILIPEKFCF